MATGIAWTAPTNPPTATKPALPLNSNVKTATASLTYSSATAKTTAAMAAMRISARKRRISARAKGSSHARMEFASTRRCCAMGRTIAGTFLMRKHVASMSAQPYHPHALKYASTSRSGTNVSARRDTRGTRRIHISATM
ncbi:unnamed protein product [Acanthoscelides obtectus]|uniref:Uncharacterized protein n=1 Tax=Acanthoscelides obtectus TaxID=200917 RepID=A0A9P0Q412_ACAOB|nr:unnamed protein product [Acanthoscelides obtectus]CAK1657803.1 hypothetical protein AOBTE_LOCUS20545 [Acanthoscelides obtectus]